jgi:hypothetical protein
MTAETSERWLSWASSSIRSRRRDVHIHLWQLQSDLAETGRERMVAPLAPRTRLTGTAGRLTPHVRVSDVEHVLPVPSMAAIAAGDLREHRGQLIAHREAIDYLFLGV